MRRAFPGALAGALLALGIFLAAPSAAHAQTSDRFLAGYNAYVKKDFATALYYWRPLAENGDAEAQYDLGIMYLNGQGVKQDTAEAIKWFSIARDAHFPQAVTAMDEMETSTKLKPNDLTEGLRRRDVYERSHAP
ncbi:MAG TPA: tetratricopeptide repeat protein [Alphaproteobacteria bacterium]|nr:tetratricopeptide repeat protein [Alphaproteobacteria bacterium]